LPEKQNTLRPEKLWHFHHINVQKWSRTESNWLFQVCNFISRPIQGIVDPWVAPGC